MSTSYIAFPEKKMKIQYKLHQIMTTVAGLALFLAIVRIALYPGGVTDKRVVVSVSCAVGSLYGLGSMRRPLTFLLPLLIVLIASPTVYDESLNVVNGSVIGCFVGYVIGVSAFYFVKITSGNGQNCTLLDQERRPIEESSDGSPANP